MFKESYVDWAKACRDGFKGIAAQRRLRPNEEYLLGMYTWVLNLVAENERLKKIIDHNLCDKHQSTVGRFGLQDGVGVTKAGGGCAVCIGERIEFENERLKKQSLNWISVKERLPEKAYDGTLYLCWSSKDGDVTFCFYCGNDSWDDPDCGWRESGDITWYVPINYPEGEQK
jgi:hypothetical protein